MKKLLCIFLLLSLSVTLSSQAYQRYEGETAEDFVKRIMPEEQEFIHPVIEANWNNKDKKVIIAFWHERELVGKNNHALYAIGKMYVPVDDVGSYQEIAIDRVPESPLEAQVVSVFFDDTDGDGKRELVVLYSWDYKHYHMAGSFYGAYVYDDINYNKLPVELSVVDWLYGGMEGYNEEGEITAHFKTAAEIKAYLNERGRKPSETFFRKSFEGKIGKDMDVSFHLERDGESVSGFYYYEKRGFDILLFGTIENDIVTIKEVDDDRNTTAIITGRFDTEGFKGEWKSVKTNKTYPVELKQLDYTIEKQPYIEGEYTAVMGCDIEISIEKKGENYIYSLKTEKREETGSVSLNRSREYVKNVIYITFEGIKWADYKGSLMNADDPDEVPSSDMYGLEGVWGKDGKITIQNYGNAMNYYIKLGECEGKYIELERKE